MAGTSPDKSGHDDMGSFDVARFVNLRRIEGVV